MKKINILASLLLGLTLFTACDDDRTSNPTFQQPTTFVLNTPAYATAVYDLEKSASVELTCSQPDYGFTAPTIYTAQVSLTNDFSTDGAYLTLPSTYTSAKMNVSASEIARAATNLALSNGKAEDEFPITTKLYVRLKAALTDGKGEIYSNAIALDNVRVYFALDPVVLPATMNIIGDDLGDANPVEMVPVNGNAGMFWHIVYVPAGGKLKFNIAKTYDGGEFGTSATLVDNATAGLSGDGDIVVANAGWYLVVVKSTIVNRDINYTVEFNKPTVYLLGETVGTWDLLGDNKFTVPADGTSYFVSPPFQFTKEVRMCVKLGDLDWWRSEFIMFDDGVISYRGAGNDQERYVGSAGKKVYLNFMTGKGKYE
ncbi:SusF/SusE family outer membrane protein [uncultured Bacteroides sp.]|uniref:SusF/SusE family outer membrane protein n=1 Tax=uncultured Bacteroides sp. TaxID=162156 RepID=UPI002AAC1358|nr:SusF/SusE family outer membrane protein [uncultured Bacteroides sp.]